MASAGGTVCSSGDASAAPASVPTTVQMGSSAMRRSSERIRLTSVASCPSDTPTENISP